MRARRVFAITRRLLIQFRRDRRTLAVLFVAPIVILSLIGYVMRGASSPAVDVVDEDGGQVSQAAVHNLLASSQVKARTATKTEAEQRLRDSQTAGYVLIPEGFGRPGALTYEVHLEGSQPGSNASVEGTAQAAVVQAVEGSLLGRLAGPLQPLARPSATVTYLRGGAGLDNLDYLGAAFVGLVIFFLVYVITSVAFLRERSQGTLERLMASPLRRGEIVLGYMLGFTILALVQGLVVLLVALLGLRIHNQGNPVLVFLIEALLAIGAVNLGIFLSMFARTELQAVQFIPLVIVPQVLLSGVVFPINTEPVVLQYISNVLPLTYAVYGMRDVMLGGSTLASPALVFDIGILALFCLAAVAAASLTLRRRIA